MRDAGAVHRVPRGEVVGAVEHQIGLRRELVELLGRDARGERHHLDVRIHRAQDAARGEDFLRADRLGAIEDLPLQVREVDLVGVGERQPADAGSGEIKGSGAAEAARPDDEDGCGAQLLLSFYPDLGEQDVPAVAEELLVVD